MGRAEAWGSGGLEGGGGRGFQETLGISHTLGSSKNEELEPQYLGYRGPGTTVAMMRH